MNIRFISTKFSIYLYYLPAKKEIKNVKMDEKIMPDRSILGIAIILVSFH